MGHRHLWNLILAATAGFALAAHPTAAQAQVGSIQLLEAQGLIVVRGTSGDDTVELTADTPTTVRATLTSGADVLEQSFDAAAVNGFVFLGFAGADSLTNRTAVPTGAVGGGGNDVLRGGSGPNFLQGDEGDDEIIGGDAGDLLRGSAGRDVINGGGGNDYVIGGADDDVLRGGDGDDRLYGDAGNDILAGDDGDDMLSGGDGDDGLDGGFGEDALYGDADDDALVGDTGPDHLAGGPGRDFLFGGRDSDELFGDDGDDTLCGDGADGQLDGGGGTNEISIDRPTRFGIVVNPANSPTSTAEDVLRAIEQAAMVADKVSLFWDFASQNELADRLGLLSFTRDLGMKSFVQVQVQFVGTPAIPPGMPQTLADPDVRNLFLDNIRTIAEIQPDYLNLGPEINFLYEFDPQEFDAFASLYQQAYALVKQVSPATQIGVSLHYLMFKTYEQHAVLEALGARDYVAITTYPIWMLDRGEIGAVGDIDPAYYGWLREQYPDDRLIVAEVGWPASGGSSPEMQAEFVRLLPTLLAGLQPEWVDWMMLNSVSFFHSGMLSQQAIDYLLEQGEDPDVAMERLNDMGLRSGDGTPRRAWFEALELNFR